MMARDIDKQPYTLDETRAAEFFFERGLGGGDDPIGALLAGYAYLVAQKNALSKPITMSDIRLAAGEGNLSAHDVLAAANAVLRMRNR